MRNFINEVEQKLEGGFDFAAALKALIGVDENEVEGIIEKLNVDELSNLIDACLNKDKATARKIIDGLNIEEKTIPHKKNRNNNKEDDDSTFNIGDTVLVTKKNIKGEKSKGIEATIKLPHGPNGTVGVLIKGKLKMVKKINVHAINEGVLGMTALPGLNMQDDSQTDEIRRMRELAGLHDDVPTEMPEQSPMVPPDMEAHPDDRLPFHDMDFDGEEDEGDFDTFGGDYHAPVSAEPPTIPMPSETINPEGDYASLERAITEIEDMIPNIKISEYKSLVARLKALLSMAEGAGRSALSEAAKKKAKRLREGFENGVWVEPNGGGEEDLSKAHGSALFSKRSSETTQAVEEDSSKINYVVAGKKSNGKIYKLGDVDSKDADLSSFKPKSHGVKVFLMIKKSDGKFALVKKEVEEDTEAKDLWDKVPAKINQHKKQASSSSGHTHGIKKEDKILPKDAPKKETPRKDDDETAGTRKTLMDYVFEADDDQLQTIGANKNDAIKALKARLGPNTTDQQAGAAFDAMLRAGTVKQKGPAFQMPAMSDDSVKQAVIPPQNPNQNAMGNGPTNLGTDMRQINQGPIQTIKPR